MGEHKKYLSLLGKICICIIIILILLVIILWNIFDEPKQSKMEKILEKDYATLNFVAEEILNYNYDHVYWSSLDGNEIELGYTEEGERIVVKENLSDGKLKEHIETLKENKCLSIRKYDNYVVFEYWIHICSSVGLVYSPDNEPQIERSEYDAVFEINKMNKENWYYHRVLGEL